MSTGEGNSPDWREARRRFEEEPSTFRSLGDFLGKSHAAVKKRADKEKWARFNPKDPFCKPARKPVKVLLGAEIRDRQIGPQDEMPGASPTDLTRRGRNLILDLMAELEFLNRNHQTLVDMVEAYVNGDKDAGARTKLLRSLDYETRAKTANNLATALAKLNDALPGKKQQAQDAASAPCSDSGWGDDLDDFRRPN